MLAIQFLTILPVPVRAPVAAREIGQSLLYYPLAGLVIGALLALVAASAVPVWGGEVGAALVLVAWVVITGALHLDGLADSVDGWKGGMGDRERTLAIMKDSCSGAMGVAAVALLVVVKYAVLQSIVSGGAWPALLATPVLARMSIVILFATTPYVSVGGLGQALSEYPPPASMLLVLVAAVVSLLVITVAGSVWAVLVTLVVLVLLRVAMVRRIGGTTGDTAGALVEVTEIAVLLCFAGL